MRSLPPSRRTTRRLLKLASLGIAGLIAGLLTACNTTTEHASNSPSYYQSDDSFYSSLPDSVDANPIPTLHHPPTSRRLEREFINTNTSPSQSRRGF